MEFLQWLLALISWSLRILEYLVQKGMLVLCLTNWLLVMRVGSALAVLGVSTNARFLARSSQLLSLLLSVVVRKVTQFP